MSEKPRVSIITPSFNQAAFLDETIQSVLTQDYPSIEYLVLDGGSTDGSQEIIRRYEERLDYWSSEPDRGQAEAINKGLVRSHGDVIGWLNSDDHYLPGAINAAVEALTAHPEWALVYGDVIAIDATGNVINLIRYQEYSLQDLMRFSIIGQPAVFFRRAAMDKAGLLDPEYHYLLDHQYWLRLAKFGGLGYVPQVWAAARFHPTSKNVDQAAGFGQEAYSILNWMEMEPELAVLLKGIKREVQAGAHWLNARYLSEAGNTRASLSAYLRSFLTHPKFALRDWKRVLFTLTGIFGAGWLRSGYSKFLARKAFRE